jgi:hypothetical protein
MRRCHWTAWAIILLTTALARAAAPDTFDYFTNHWNVIGLKNYNFGARVSPDNRIMLAGKPDHQSEVPPSRRLTNTGPGRAAVKAFEK